MFLSFRRLLIASTLLAATGAAAPVMAQVQAQSGMDISQQAYLTERLNRVEQQLRDMQGVLYSVERPSQSVPVRGENVSYGQEQQRSTGTFTPGGNQADLSVRLTAVEAELANLTGMMEQMQFQLNQQQQVIARLSGGDSMAMGSSSSGSGMVGPVPGDDPIARAATGQVPSDSTQAPTGAPSDLVAGDVPDTTSSAPAVTVDLPDDPDAAYNMAYNAVLAADYDRAQAALEAYVEKFPESPRTAEAKFLLGEVYLATGANSSAARVFLNHVGQYQDDPRAPEAYLKLGVAFSRLQKPDEACRVFRVGLNKFPNIPDQLRRRYQSEQQAAGCS